jgi:hypothetical protein
MRRAPGLQGRYSQSGERQRIVAAAP